MAMIANVLLVITILKAESGAFQILNMVKAMTDRDAILSFTPVIDNYASVAGFGAGSPAKSCVDGYPKHTVPGYGYAKPQNSTSPFLLKVSADRYSPGDILKVILDAPKGRTFKGFKVSVFRKEGDTEEMVGNFTLTHQGQQVAWYPQRARDKNCITHTKDGLYTQVEANWQAPQTTLGDLIFEATVIEKYETWWRGIQKHVVANFQVQTTDFKGKMSTKVNSIVTAGKCGVTKGCMFHPRHCSGEDCSYVVTYHEDAATKKMVFEMIGKAEGYLSLGLSKDRIMGDDLTYTCIDDGDVINVQVGHNPSHHNDRHRITGITNIQTQRMNGKIYCRFTSPTLVTLQLLNGRDGTLKPRIYDLKENWYFMLAWGSIYPGLALMQKHVEYPLTSETPINLQSVTIQRSHGLLVEMKIHAGMSMIAWLFLAGLARILARHYRDAFNKKEVFGARVWFQLHRAITILIGLVTIAIVLLIFGTLKWTWSSTAANHSIVGLVVLGLLVLQTVAGFLRPGPDAKSRRVFNWVHRISGWILYILAVATIILGAWIPFIAKETRYWLLVTVGASIAVQLLWDIIYEIIRYKRRRGYDLNEKATEEVYRKFSVDNMALGEYIITMLVCTAACVVVLIIY